MGKNLPGIIKGVSIREFGRCWTGQWLDQWLDQMPQTTITHLPVIGSDDCPLIMEIVPQENEEVRYLMFINSWVYNLAFMEVVETSWNKQVESNSMWVFHKKLKRFSKTLSCCPNKEFDDTLKI